MLQRDSLFRRREEPSTRTATPSNVVSPTPAPTAPSNAAAAGQTGQTIDASRGDERKEAKLIVGPDIKMKGVEVTDCDTLVVEGRIEATLDARVLQIAANGVFQGTVAVDIAEIHGALEGELTVRKQLVLHATGRVSGKIHYAKIKVEEGAEIAGEIGMIEKSTASHASRPIRASLPAH